jgi:GDP-L-fucose synthase
VCKAVGFAGTIEHDLTKPDGTPRKLMDSSRLSATGWAPSISLEEGLADAYRWFLENRA